mgnify:CR=1 FL=1
MIDIKADSKKELLKLEACGPKGVILDEIATSVGCLLAKMANGNRKFYRHSVKQVSDKMYECMQESMDAIEDPDNINIDCKDRKSLEKIDELSKFLEKWLENEEGDDDDDEEE